MLELEYFQYPGRVFGNLHKNSHTIMTFKQRDSNCEHAGLHQCAVFGLTATWTQQRYPSQSPHHISTVTVYITNANHWWENWTHCWMASQPHSLLGRAVQEIKGSGIYLLLQFNRGSLKCRGCASSWQYFDLLNFSSHFQKLQAD